MSDVGLHRSHNEDSIASDPQLGLVILADGMGGYKAGEVASAIAVNMVMDQMRQGVRQMGQAEVDEATGFFRETLLLTDAIDKANSAIHQTAKSQPQCKGMGTTIVSVLFFDDRMTVGHVGDSRLYRMRGRSSSRSRLTTVYYRSWSTKGFTPLSKLETL